MSLDLENLLLDRQVTICYWELGMSTDKLRDFFLKDTEWRTITQLSEILTWINYGDVKNLIVGTEDTQRMAEAKQILEKIPIEKRREIFFILISPQLHTLDPKEAFIYSANLVINPKDLGEFERIYSRAQIYWKRLYDPYRSAFEKLKEVLL